jgi:hypothetical protein
MTRLLVGITVAVVVFWATEIVAEMTLVRAGTAQEVNLSNSDQNADFEEFKAQVEPIFVKKRPGHARCYVCHGMSGAVGKMRSPFKLQELSPGKDFWTEDQSRQNFEMVVTNLVDPVDPLKSKILVHPLASSAGGEGMFHIGGQQFPSRDDPDWQKIEKWVQDLDAHRTSAGAAKNEEK